MELVSCIPGRIRVKHSNLYKNSCLASQLYNALYSINGVYFVKINIYTGKLLIIYDKNILSPEELLSKIRSSYEIDYKSNENYSSSNKVLESKNTLGYENPKLNDERSISSSIFINRVLNVLFKPVLLISISLGLTLLSGQYILILKFLLITLIYEFVLSMLNRFYRKKLYRFYKSQSSEKMLSSKLNFQSSFMKFYNSMTPVISIIAILYSLSTANYIPLLSIVFLLTFNSLNKSTSVVLTSISRGFKTNDINIVSLDKLDKISDLSTIIIDKTQDTSDLDESFIESLREHGFYDIHIFTTNFNIEGQANSLELTVFRVGDNDFEKIKYIRSLKRANKTIALIANESASANVLNKVDISICLSSKLTAFNDGPWDLVIRNSNCNSLGETIDYIKYMLEKIYQNQLISLWLNILGIVLSFSRKIKLIYIALISIFSNILVYLNSLGQLNYEPIYE